MNFRNPAPKGLLATLLCFQLATPAMAELSCAPKGAPTTYPVESDAFFAKALAIWQHITKGRPVEGTPGKSCEAVIVVGYEGFPTMHCSYSDPDAGRGYYPPLKAEVIVLEPSAKELARWTVHACRVNAATDKTMDGCLTKLTGEMIGANGGQFPIVGSVVESYCDFNRTKCAGPKDPFRQPANTWFRDGVNVYYASLAKWDSKTYDYTKIFNTAVSDKDVYAWKVYSRVSNGQRSDWTSWRQHIGKPVIPDGVEPKGFDLSKAGWQAISREVHKRACSSDSNELMDAVTFTRKFAN